MKHPFVLLLFIPFVSVSQYDYGFMQEFYFGRVPSARAEAMGRSFVALEGDLTTAFYNPAGIAGMEGIELNVSFASPFYLMDKATYDYYSAGYKVNDLICFGLSYRKYDNNISFPFVDENGNSGVYDGFEENYGLTLASNPFRSLYVGLNANLLRRWGIEEDRYTPYFDLGALYRFKLGGTGQTQHHVNTGVSVSNFTKSKERTEYLGNVSYDELPVILRTGLAYEFIWEKGWFSDSLESVKITVHGEHQYLFNNDYQTALKCGFELLLFELIAIRAGYYNETIYDFEYPDVNYNHISDLTYGIGVQLPLDKLAPKIPIRLYIDYTKLDQPRYSNIDWPEIGYFQSMNFRLRWYLGRSV